MKVLFVPPLILYGINLLQTLWSWSRLIQLWSCRAIPKWMWWWRWWCLAEPRLFILWTCQRAALCRRPSICWKQKVLASREFILWAVVFRLLFDVLQCVRFNAVWQVWAGVQPVGIFLKHSQWRAGQTKWSQILAPLHWWHGTDRGLVDYQL